MKSERLYLSTIGADAVPTARKFGLGLEIAEYCTADHMDTGFPETDAAVREELRGISGRVLHAPFNELFPCAIDSMARELARHRYRQAIALAQVYGAPKIVIHGGYHPKMYYPCWYTEQSVIFWRDFMREVPAGLTICLENVMEEEPRMLLDIVSAVDDPRLRLCLDMGHANVYSEVPVEQWLESFAPYLSHFHLHNNHGDFDAHQPLPEGNIPIGELLTAAESCCPAATYTLELMEAESSVRYLLERGILEE